MLYPDKDLQNADWTKRIKDKISDINAKLKEEQKEKQKKESESKENK